MVRDAQEMGREIQREREEMTRDVGREKGKEGGGQREKNERKKKPLCYYLFNFVSKLQTLKP